ncbi:unnamed protein product [Anisakis simplex]|uniref:THAP-type domain-containing protein n=1 Tax=Anisakis simplex TaxID=6269 RepID=A0A0M3KBX5_ANISI|nr:unnamed protein product [Anisakis simplex]
MDKCVFCGWSRRSAYPAIRFFGIPKEPGMKRVQWLYAIGDREVTNKDRVCSVHFRSGRPSSDPSHEDFVPHLFLNREPPPEVLQYLEELAEMKPDPYAAGYEVCHNAFLLAQLQANIYQLASIHRNKLEHGRTCKPLILKRKRKPSLSKTQLANNGGAHQSSTRLTPEVSSSQASIPQQQQSQSQYQAQNLQQHQTHQETICSSQIAQPNIPYSQTTTTSQIQVQPQQHQQMSRNNIVTLQIPETGQIKRVKLQMLQKPIVEAAGVKPGQTVIIKRRVPVLRSSFQALAANAVEDRRVPQLQRNIPEENIIVAEEQTVQ